MFRVTNGRTNQIVELEAKVLFSRIEGSRAQVRRAQTRAIARDVLSAELDRRASDRREESDARRDTHAASSPEDAEFLILLAGIDETFSQTVHARSSYKPEEIVVGEKFVNIYNASTRRASSASTSAD